MTATHLCLVSDQPVPSLTPRIDPQLGVRAETGFVPDREYTRADGIRVQVKGAVTWLPARRAEPVYALVTDSPAATARLRERLSGAGYARVLDRENTREAVLLAGVKGEVNIQGRGRASLGEVLEGGLEAARTSSGAGGMAAGAADVLGVAVAPLNVVSVQAGALAWGLAKALGAPGGIGFRFSGEYVPTDADWVRVALAVRDMKQRGSEALVLRLSGAAPAELAAASLEEVERALLP